MALVKCRAMSLVTCRAMSLVKCRAVALVKCKAVALVKCRAVALVKCMADSLVESNNLCIKLLIYCTVCTFLPVAEWYACWSYTREALVQFPQLLR